jgi:3,4-dihydroxy 2-butanone 4-phosphate synthase/GTP cyclohydrolase II
LVPGDPQSAREVARVLLPTSAGEFEARAFQCGSGAIHLALVKGELGDGCSVLTRVHSECVTGDALGSLRCDCGIQLRAALRAIAAEGRGVLIYATGHEGRGIGLVNKLRAYSLQEEGLDTFEANVHLGFAPDARDYDEVAACLAVLGVRSLRLLTNNPHKARALECAGVTIDDIVRLSTSAHVRNRGYLRTKELRMQHNAPAGDGLVGGLTQVTDVSALLGFVAPTDRRPYVVLKYAQTLDGRIATHTGDSKWISGEAERRASHALRAACDAVLVGVGTVLADDPQLTVRLMPGASPLRVVLDSTLRVPSNAQILGDDAPTLIVTTERSDPSRRKALQRRGVAVEVVDADPPWGVDIEATLGLLRANGARALLVEGGAAVITSFLRGRLVNRLIVGVAPTILGTGTDAVGNLRTARVTDGLRLSGRAVHSVGDDVLVAGNLS